MNPTDEEAIFAEVEEFGKAWNRGDAKAAASFHTEDSLRVGAVGDMQQGRREIEAAYDKLLHQTLPGAKVRQDRGTVRVLTPELATWQGGIEITPPDGRPPMKGHVLQVMKKVDRRWLILEAHPKFFPPRP